MKPDVEGQFVITVFHVEYARRSLSHTRAHNVIDERCGTRRMGKIVGPSRTARFVATTMLSFSRPMYDVHLELPSRIVYAARITMSQRRRSIVFAVPLALATLANAPSAAAFCGFYVAGADQQLYNNATSVVLMREGTRTVLSMQNNYQGPPENFAMVVPVPVVLNNNGVFARHKVGQQHS